MKEEKCGMGCGREWNEDGGDNGFDDCVSAYHKSGTAKPTGTNAAGGKEYRMSAPMGKLFNPKDENTFDMNHVIKLAMEHGYKREPIQLQSNIGVMNVFAWQKDVMDMLFWAAIAEAIEWKEAPTKLGTNFFEVCMAAGWSRAVEYIIEIIKSSHIWEKK